MSAESKTENGTLDVDGAALLISQRTGLKIKPRTLYGWAAKGILPHRRIVGRIVFDAVAIEAFIEATHSGAAIPTLYAGSGPVDMT
jgi:hypothetical protein